MVTCQDRSDTLGIEHGTKVTLTSLAEYLGVPRDWLEDEGWEDSSYTTTGENKRTIERVAINYTKPESADIVTRYRCALSGSGKFKWQTKPRAHPKNDGLLYAYDDLDECAGAGVFLVEGESDALVIKKVGGKYTVGLLGAQV